MGRRTGQTDGVHPAPQGGEVHVQRGCEFHLVIAERADPLEGGDGIVTEGAAQGVKLKPKLHGHSAPSRSRSAAWFAARALSAM